MGYVAEARVSTPLTREFELWVVTFAGAKPTTVREYIIAVEQLVGHVAAGTLNLTPRLTSRFAPKAKWFTAKTDPDWSTIGVDALESFLQIPVANGTRPPSPTTMKKRKYAAIAFFDFLESHGVAAPARVPRRLRVPSQVPARPKPMPDTAFLAMWNGRMTMEDRVWAGMGFFCGFRRREMCFVQCDNFDLDARRVTDFDRKGGKKGDVVYGRIIDMMGERGLPKLHKAGIQWEDALDKFLAARTGERYVLPYAEDYAAMDDVPNAINKRFVKYTSDHTPHSLRHSFATNLFRMDVPAMAIKDQMSHSNIDTTNGYIDTLSAFEAAV